MKTFKRLQVYINLYTKFLIISLASGATPSRANPFKCIFPKFSKYLPKFLRSFQ